MLLVCIISIIDVAVYKYMIAMVDMKYCHFPSRTEMPILNNIISTLSYIKIYPHIYPDSAF